MRAAKVDGIPQTGSKTSSLLTTEHCWNGFLETWAIRPEDRIQLQGNNISLGILDKPYNNSRILIIKELIRHDLKAVLF